MCASMAPVPLLAARKNTQPRLGCLPRRHFISHYQQRKLRAFPQASRRLVTKTTSASLNRALCTLTQSLQNPGKSVQRVPLGLGSCESSPQSCACIGYRALPCSQNGIRLRRETASSYGFGTGVIDGFERYWENCLDDRIKTGQPSTNAGTQVTDCALGKSLKQIKLSSSILACFSCIFQFFFNFFQIFFPHAVSTSTGSCRPSISWHSCSVPGAEILAGPPSEPLACFPAWKHSPALSIAARPPSTSCSLPPPACILPRGLVPP